MRLYDDMKKKVPEVIRSKYSIQAIGAISVEDWLFKLDFSNPLMTS